MLPFHRIAHVKRHAELKPVILYYINKFIDNSLITPASEISKTDWNLPRDVRRDYAIPFLDLIAEELPPIYDALGGKTMEIINFWFQQYTKTNRHDWHTHSGAMFTNIYYLELPDGAPVTEFKNPDNINEIIKFDVKEGDILIVPSFYIHRSPPMESDTRKTVISLNTNTEPTHERL